MRPAAEVDPVDTAPDLVRCERASPPRPATADARCRHRRRPAMRPQVRPRRPIRPGPA